MNGLTVRVVKVGGSLFELPNVSERLDIWLRKQSDAHHVLITGGGKLVDQVRQWHSINPWDEEQAHWLCIELMSVTARLLQLRIPQTPIINDVEQLRRRFTEPGCSIFDSFSWLRHGEPTASGQPLPASWDVTSDSIAARLATVLRANELVLLKSTSPSDQANLHQLAEAGFLDAAFPVFAADIPAIRFVNLRDDSMLAD